MDTARAGWQQLAPQSMPSSRTSNEFGGLQAQFGGASKICSGAGGWDRASPRAFNRSTDFAINPARTSSKALRLESGRDIDRLHHSFLSFLVAAADGQISSRSAAIEAGPPDFSQPERRQPKNQRQRRDIEGHGLEDAILMRLGSICKDAEEKAAAKGEPPDVVKLCETWRHAQQWERES